MPLVPRDPVRFNRACNVAAALWLGVVLPASYLARPTLGDFHAFYAAAVAVRGGEWDAVYPARLADKPYFIYWAFELKPRQRELAARHGFDYVEPFIQPPWTAVLLAPLAWVPYRAAYAGWVAASVACAWVVAVAAGRSAAACAGRPVRLAGAVTLLVACSPLAFRIVRSGNVSMMAGAAVAAALAGLRADRAGRAAAGLVVGGVLKYATVALVPLAVVLGRWRVLAAVAAAGLAVLGLSLAVAGPAAFADFDRTVAATAGDSVPWRVNQSVWGFLLRVTGAAPLPATVRVPVRAAQWVLLAGLLAILWRRRTAIRRGGAELFAAAAALLAWLLAFGPVCWEHYLAYLLPLWGWLAWEGRQSVARGAAAAAAIGLVFVPLPVVLWLRLDEPWNSSVLASLALTGGLAWVRLLRGDARRGPAGEALSVTPAAGRED
ncbi:MAG: hypothetical protein JWO31_2198 [Phycisphaerales bacterium]|nr:hypothetical protein [Phycisphaerales bacterium]